MIGENREIMKNYDMISIIMIYVGNPDKENYTGIIKPLGVLLSAKLSAEEKKTDAAKRIQHSHDRNHRGVGVR